MKIYERFLSFLICALLLVACNDDNEQSAPIVILQQNEITDIPYQGGTYEVALTTEADWTAVGKNSWCKVLTSKGCGSRTLVLQVEANLGDARQGEIAVYAQEQEFVITLRQEAKSTTDELKYQIPIIFHVIYYDAADPAQNPDGADIYAMLEEVDRIYKNAGPESVDLNLEFTLAEYDPQGNKLKEKGIERVFWPQEELDPTEIMEDKTGKYKHFIWEPNDYVNILLYPFSKSNILGISTFPYNPMGDAEHKIEGLQEAPINLTLENLNYVHGISINSSYMLAKEDVLAKYVDDSEIKNLLNRQTKLYITLAHELGHYFGLRHTFSEVMGDWWADTDYCTDTGSYIRLGQKGYEAKLNALIREFMEDPSKAEGFDWTSLFLRDGDQMFGEYEAHNIMDYMYCYLDQFTEQQRNRVRFVLEYSPLIPGPKKNRETVTRSQSGIVDLPVVHSVGHIPLGHQ